MLGVPLVHVLVQSFQGSIRLVGCPSKHAYPLSQVKGECCSLVPCVFDTGPISIFPYVCDILEEGKNHCDVSPSHYRYMFMIVAFVVGHYRIT